MQVAGFEEISFFLGTSDVAEFRIYSLQNSRQNINYIRVDNNNRFLDRQRVRDTLGNDGEIHFLSKGGGAGGRLCVCLYLWYRVCLSRAYITFPVTLVILTPSGGTLFIEAQLHFFEHFGRVPDHQLDGTDGLLQQIDGFLVILAIH